MNTSLLLVLVAALLLAAVARRYNLSAPLVLVVAGLAIGLIPGAPTVVLNPDVVLFVILPPLLWTAGLQSSYVALRRNFRPIALLAIGLPLATAITVGVVAYYTVADLTPAAALALGAIVAPPDAVAALAVGRRLGLPRQMMTLLGGESLLNDATALTVYKVALSAAIGTAVSWSVGLGTFVLAAAGGAVVGLLFGLVVDAIRSRLDDPLMESGIGLVAPFIVYLVAEEIHSSGVLAVVVAAVFLGQRSTHASYATRLQDQAVWKALQLILESFAFLLIGLQLPGVIREMRGMPASLVIWSSVAVFLAVLLVRIVWIYVFTYVPRALFAGRREGDPTPSAAEVFVVTWAGMRGVVSLAAAFAVPLTTLSGAAFPGRAHIVFLTFVVVVGTLLLHGLTLPWVIRAFGVRSDDAHRDAVALAAAQDRAARAAGARLEELLAAQQHRGPADIHEHAAQVLHGWNERRRNAAWERLGRSDEEIGESPASAFRRLRLEMLASERRTFIADRDAGRIDDEVLRTALRGLDLEEATLRRD